MSDIRQVPVPDALKRNWLMRTEKSVVGNGDDAKDVWDFVIFTEDGSYKAWFRDPHPDITGPGKYHVMPNLFDEFDVQLLCEYSNGVKDYLAPHKVICPLRDRTG